MVQSIPNLVSPSTPCHEEEEASFEVEVDRNCNERERYCYARNGPGASSVPAMAVPLVPKAEPPSSPVPRVESVEDITGIWSMFQDAEGKPLVREDHQVLAQVSDCVLMPRDLGP